jgi:hypothetical protein
VIWGRFVEFQMAPNAFRDNLGKNKPGMYFEVPKGSFYNMKHRVTKSNLGNSLNDR